MNIFGKFLSQNFIKIYSKTHQIAPFKKNSRGTCPPNPPNKRVALLWVACPSRHATRPAQTQKKMGPPLPHPVYAHEK